MYLRQILWCTYANAAHDLFDSRRFQALQQVASLDWDLFLSTAVNEFVGWSPSQAPAIVESLRSNGLQPADLVRGWEQLAHIDVTPLLPQVRVPTLILEREDGWRRAGAWPK